MNSLFESIFGNKNLEEYCSGVFSDSLDKIGLRNQVINEFRMNNSRLRLFGRVRTILLETIETDDERIAKGLGFLDSLEPNDILVIKGSMEYAYFGELMTRLSVEKKLAGAVIDGLTRDTYYTQTVEFPVFARGYSAKDIKGRGRVAEVDVPITIGNLSIHPHDYAFADSDCLVFIPNGDLKTLAPEVKHNVEEEARIKEMIRTGQTVSHILKEVKAF